MIGLYIKRPRLISSKIDEVCDIICKSTSALTVQCDETVDHLTKKVLNEDLFPDGVDASQVAAQLEAVLLRGVVGRRALEDAVARSVETAASKPPPLRPPTHPRLAAIYITNHIYMHAHHSLTI